MNMSRERKAVKETATETLFKDLLDSLIAEIRILPKPWPAMTEQEQNDTIDRLSKRLREAAGTVTHIIASNGQTVVQGELDAITIRDGVKAVIKFSSSAPSLHSLYEAQGSAIMVIVDGADASDYTHGMHKVKGEKDQRSLDLGKEYTDGDGEGMDGYDDVTEVNLIEVAQPLMIEE